MSTENFSVPQLTPVFSFTTQEGDEINVYAAKTGHTTVSFITLVTEEFVEYAWAITTNDYLVAFRELVEEARDTYHMTVQVPSNPFDELLINDEMMQKLENIISKL